MYTLEIGKKKRDGYILNLWILDLISTAEADSPGRSKEGIFYEKYFSIVLIEKI